MIDAGRLIAALRSRDASSYVGVPCSFLAPLIDEAIGDSTVRYTAAVSEGEATGIAFGTWLAGRTPVTFCQNSGLGNMVNPITSLMHPCRVPLLMLCTWRGQPGLSDEPQHELMGRALGALLDTIEVEWTLLGDTATQLDAAIETAWESMTQRSLPFCLIVEKNTIARTEVDPPPVRERRSGLAIDLLANGRCTRFEALERILGTVSDEVALVATTGKTGRELFALCDRPQHFYCVGAMGCASAIGLGLSLGTDRPVLVLDGDGAALMRLGNMATIGREGPSNLVHVILDNGVHDSTGGQQTAAANTRFGDVAIACGYRRAYSCDAPCELEDAISQALAAPGPHLVHMKIQPGSRGQLGRPSVHPADVARRFRNFAGCQTVQPPGAVAQRSPV